MKIEGGVCAGISHKLFSFICKFKKLIDVLQPIIFWICMEIRKGANKILNWKNKVNMRTLLTNLSENFEDEIN